MAEMERNEIVVLSSTLVRMEKLFDRGIGSQGDYISDATVTATIYDTDGITELPHDDDAPVGWPVTLVYVNGTRGQYDYTVLNPLKVVKGETYKVVINSQRPSGVKRRFIAYVPASDT